MTIPFVPILVLIIGVLAWVLSSKEPAKEIGKWMFIIGLFWVVGFYNGSRHLGLADAGGSLLERAQVLPSVQTSGGLVTTYPGSELLEAGAGSPLPFGPCILSESARHRLRRLLIDGSDHLGGQLRGVHDSDQLVAAIDSPPHLATDTPHGGRALVWR